MLEYIAEDSDDCRHGIEKQNPVHQSAMFDTVEVEAYQKLPVSTWNSDSRRKRRSERLASTERVRLDWSPSIKEPSSADCERQARHRLLARWMKLTQE